MMLSPQNSSRGARGRSPAATGNPYLDLRVPFFVFICKTNPPPAARGSVASGDGRSLFASTSAVNLYLFARQIRRFLRRIFCFHRNLPYSVILSAAKNLT